MSRADSLRIPPDADLTWLLCCADAALGHHASALEPGPSCSRNPDGRITDRRLRDARRQAALLRRWKALPLVHRDVLWAAYGAHQWPVQLRQHLGGCVGVALLTPAARDGHAADAGRPRTRLEWLTAQAGRSKVLDPIAKQAAAMVAEALVAWWGRDYATTNG
jgi:hypothetical protein